MRGATVEEKPEVMLAQVWDRQRDISGWLASEKWDGVRAYWTGTQFLSRNGNVYNPPAWFVADLPKEPLDGELWLGRGRFHECSGICRRAMPRLGGQEWKQMRYLVFDAPTMQAPFSERIKRAAQMIAACKFAQAVEQITIPHNDVMPHLLAQIEKQGGEGLVVRAPDSAYEKRRSPAMLKVTTREHIEVHVIGYEPGEGSNVGVMGALRIRLQDGTEAKVGTGFTYKQRQKPPPIGARITIAHKGIGESGKPREPSYIGRRNYE